MYAIVNRRRINPDRAQETRERAASEFMPKLQRAPGFVSFTLVQGEDGVNTAVIVWEDKAHADAFRAERETWTRALDEMGHRVETHEEGEVLQHVTPGA